MKRRHLTFDVDGTSCAATLDEADELIGLLIVTGGNEVRAGAFGGQAAIAAKIAERGYPVFRFDRRGVGDSEGVNTGFRGSGPDIRAAAEAFNEQMPHLRRIVAFGNCDAASALVLLNDLKLCLYVIANPWIFSTVDEEEKLSPAAVRKRYAARLRDPRHLCRLLRGQVSLRKLWVGIKRALSNKTASTRPNAIMSVIARLQSPIRILIGGRDRTGNAFLEKWNTEDTRIAVHPDADHAFSGDAQKWLEDQLVDALEEAGKLDMS